MKTRTAPAASSKLIRKLNYLEKAKHSDIAYCARFVSNPKRTHGELVQSIGRYLKHTFNKRTIYCPVIGKDLKVFVDATFCGDWNSVEAMTDKDTARSRHGYIINYAGCPLLWKPQLQYEIVLSATESEYTGSSYALRDTIPIMELLKEMKKYEFPIQTSQVKVQALT